MTTALLVEIYAGYGLKFQDSIDELNKQIGDPEKTKAKPPTEQQEAASMAMLQSLMGGSDFGGPRG